MFIYHINVPTLFEQVHYKLSTLLIGCYCDTVINHQKLLLKLGVTTIIIIPSRQPRLISLITAHKILLLQ